MKSAAPGLNTSPVEVTNISRHGFWLLLEDEVERAGTGDGRHARTAEAIAEVAGMVGGDEEFVGLRLGNVAALGRHADARGPGRGTAVRVQVGAGPHREHPGRQGGGVFPRQCRERQATERAIWADHHLRDIL